MEQWKEQIGWHVSEDLPLLGRITKEVLDGVKQLRFLQEDVLVAGYPRSGTTWTSEIIWLVCKNGDVSEAQKSHVTTRYQVLEFQRPAGREGVKRAKIDETTSGSEPKKGARTCQGKAEETVNSNTRIKAKAGAHTTMDEKVQNKQDDREGGAAEGRNRLLNGEDTLIGPPHDHGCAGAPRIPVNGAVITSKGHTEGSNTIHSASVITSPPDSKAGKLGQDANVSTLDRQEVEEEVNVNENLGHLGSRITGNIATTTYGRELEDRKQSLEGVPSAANAEEGGAIKLQVGSDNGNSGSSELIPASGTIAGPRFFKSHLPVSFYQKQWDDVRFKVVVVMRNLKDVLVSTFHFYRSYLGLVGSWDDFFESFKRNELLFGSWFDYNLAWWALRSRPELLIIKYEDMRRDPRHAVRLMAEHCRHSLTDEQIDAIVEQTSFRVMASQPTYRFTRTYDGRSVSTIEMVRKGAVGDWRAYFNSEQSDYVDELLRKRTDSEGLSFES